MSAGGRFDADGREAARYTKGVTHRFGEGMTIAGRYTLVRALGEGGMGAVYEAEDTSLHRRVALKTLLPELASDPDTLLRFHREAKAAAGLGHPNIVQIIDLVEEPSKAPILVMELIRGQSLKQIIAAEGRLEPARAAFIAMQVLSALAVTHEAHIIHRDIKPANVFVTRTCAIADFVTLLDFGVAKLLDASVSTAQAPLTRFGQVIGTRSYMAPEQTLGLTATERSDLFAVGALLFHALTGSTLYACIDAPTPDDFARGQRPLSSLRQLAPWLDASLVAIVERALALEPAERTRLQAQWPTRSACTCRRRTVRRLMRARRPSMSPSRPATIPRSLPVPSRRRRATAPRQVRTSSPRLSLPRPLDLWVTPRPGRGLRARACPVVRQRDPRRAPGSHWQ